jgi:hypothetical protein
MHELNSLSFVWLHVYGMLNRFYVWVEQSKFCLVTCVWHVKQILCVSWTSFMDELNKFCLVTSVWHVKQILCVSWTSFMDELNKFCLLQVYGMSNKFYVWVEQVLFGYKCMACPTGLMHELNSLSLVTYVWHVSWNKNN